MAEFDFSGLWNQINSNVFLFSLAVSIAIPFAVILLGYGIHLLGLTLATLAGLFMHSWSISLIINYLFFPGVMLHELAHALFAVLTGAKVTKLVLFKKEGDTLGHVEFRHRGGALLVAFQNIFISSAPMFVGGAVLFACHYVIRQIPGAPLWLKIMMGYLGVSMFFHMTMSPQDIKVYVKGIPLFSCILFLVVFIFRLLGVF